MQVAYSRTLAPKYSAALSPFLNGRAFHTTKRAVNTAVTLFRFQYCLALLTLIKECTCIFGHALFFGKATLLTGYGGFELYNLHCGYKFTTYQADTDLWLISCSERFSLLFMFFMINLGVLSRTFYTIHIRLYFFYILCIQFTFL